jgi:hypothetical protein
MLTVWVGVAGSFVIVVLLMMTAVGRIVMGTGVGVGTGLRMTDTGVLPVLWAGGE